MADADEQRRKDRATAYYEAPFIPGQTTIAAEFRVANALEYIAYQMHDIRESQRKISGRQSPVVPQDE